MQYLPAGSLLTYQLPAEVSVQVYTPSALVAYLGKAASPLNPAGNQPVTTRRQYARIRVVDSSIRTPLSSSNDSSTPVPFTVKLEPLSLDVLPVSIVPTLAFMIPVALVGSLIATFIYRYAKMLARQGKGERQVEHPKQE